MVTLQTYDRPTVYMVALQTCDRPAVYMVALRPDGRPNGFPHLQKNLPAKALVLALPTLLTHFVIMRVHM